MLHSKEQLINHARANGYKPEILEKVYRLLDTFHQIMSIPVTLIFAPFRPRDFLRQAMKKTQVYQIYIKAFFIAWREKALV